MPRLDNTRRLVQLMDDHDLSVRDVAEISGRQPKTIRCWRCGSAIVPDVELDRLELHLKVKSLEAQLLALQGAPVPSTDQQESCHA